jgi:sec-independent protein translocase protein TatC
MSSGNKYEYSDDMFAETRMSFGDHIEDLRTHLIRAFIWFGLAVAVSFFFGKVVLRFIARPVEHELGKFWDKYYVANSRKVENELAEGNEDLQRRNRPIPFRLQIPAQEFFKQTGIKDPRAPKEADFDMKAALEPLMQRLEIDDWLGPPDASHRRWLTFEGARILDPLRVYARLTQNQALVGKRPALSTLNVQEAFMVYLKVSVLTGFVLASPMVFYQIWSFVAAGLYPHEKRYVNVYLPFSILLFFIGVVLCEWIVIPKAVEALLWFNEWLGMEPELRLNEWLGFAIILPVVFGLSFQTPLVMLFLERMRIMGIETYRRSRRIAYFILAVFSCIAVPTSDLFSVLFLLVPMCLLYELGIWLCIWLPRQQGPEIEIPESEEMVEV